MGMRGYVYNLNLISELGLVPRMKYKYIYNIY